MDFGPSEGLTRAIRCHVHHAQINPDGIHGLGHRWSTFALGEMQVVGALSPHQVSTAESPRGVNQQVMLPFPQDQAAGHTPLHGIEREAIQTQQAVGTCVITDTSTRTKLRTGERFLMGFALLLLGSCCLDSFNGFRTRTAGQLRPQPKAGTSLTIDAVMSGVSVRDALIPTHGSDPGCRGIETLLCLVQHGIVTVYVKLDTDGSSECFVHKRSIAEHGTNVKGFPACGQPFFPPHSWKPGVSKNGGRG